MLRARSRTSGPPGRRASGGRGASGAPPIRSRRRARGGGRHRPRAVPVRPHGDGRAGEQAPDLRARDLDGPRRQRIGLSREGAQRGEADEERPRAGQSHPPLAPGNGRGVAPGDVVVLQGRLQKVVEQRPRDRVRAGSSRSSGSESEAGQLVGGKIAAARPQIARDVAQDVRQLESLAESHALGAHAARGPSRRGPGDGPREGPSRTRPRTRRPGRCSGPGRRAMARAARCVASSPGKRSRSKICPEVMVARTRRTWARSGSRQAIEPCRGLGDALQEPALRRLRLTRSAGGGDGVDVDRLARVGAPQRRAGGRADPRGGRAGCRRRCRWRGRAGTRVRWVRAASRGRMASDR